MKNKVNFYHKLFSRIEIILFIPIILIGVLPSAFPNSKIFIGIKDFGIQYIKPYVMPILFFAIFILMLFYIFNISRSNTKEKEIKISDIIRLGITMIVIILMINLLYYIIHIIFLKYSKNYSPEGFFDIRVIKITIIFGIVFTAILCASQYGRYIKQCEKSKNINEDEIKNLIKKGESLTVEFKQSFFLDIKKNHEEDYIKKESLKNIAGFINKEGGTLFIGICDNGEIYGIENDNYKSNDDYLKRFKDIVKTSFIPGILNLIHYEIIIIDNKKILRIDCPRGDELVYLKGEPDWAYVRTNPAVEKISGAALINYAIQRKKEKKNK